MFNHGSCLRLNDFIKVVPRSEIVWIIRYNARPFHLNRFHNHLWQWLILEWTSWIIWKYIVSAMILLFNITNWWRLNDISVIDWDLNFSFFSKVFKLTCHLVIELVFYKNSCCFLLHGNCFFEKLLECEFLMIFLFIIAISINRWLLHQ